jgi:signal transduction histidine kinase
VREPTQAEGDRYLINVVVTDQGIGLNEHDRANIFQPYFRSSSDENRAMNANSNGIGLNLSKRLAKALGGDLILSSQYRTGCQFVLQLQL